MVVWPSRPSRLRGLRSRTRNLIYPQRLLRRPRTGCRAVRGVYRCRRHLSALSCFLATLVTMFWSTLVAVGCSTRHLMIDRTLKRASHRLKWVPVKEVGV